MEETRTKVQKEMDELAAAQNRMSQEQEAASLAKEQSSREVLEGMQAQLKRQEEEYHARMKEEKDRQRREMEESKDSYEKENKRLLQVSE